MPRPIVVQFGAITLSTFVVPLPLDPAPVRLAAMDTPRRKTARSRAVERAQKQPPVRKAHAEAS
jgi:hypothetical protein